MHRQSQTLTLMALAVFLLASTPVEAAESGWLVHVYGAWVEPDVDFLADNPDFPLRVSSEGALGFGGGLEYRIRPWVGVGVDVLHARPKIVLEGDLPEGTLAVSDGLSFTPVTVGPVFHITPDKPVDVTATVLLGFVSYGDLLFETDMEDLRLEGKSDLAWGLGAAVDIYPTGSGFAIHAGVRYLDTTAEFTNPDEDGPQATDYDPIVVTFGVGYRF